MGHSWKWNPRDSLSILLCFGKFEQDSKITPNLLHFSFCFSIPSNRRFAKTCILLIFSGAKGDSSMSETSLQATMKERSCRVTLSLSLCLSLLQWAVDNAGFPLDFRRFYSVACMWIKINFLIVFPSAVTVGMFAHWWAMLQ